MTDESSEYYTVVYAVSKTHHQEWWGMIRPMFLAHDKPIHVCVVSPGDAIEELGDAIEELDALRRER